MFLLYICTSKNDFRMFLIKVFLWDWGRLIRLNSRWTKKLRSLCFEVMVKLNQIKTTLRIRCRTFVSNDRTISSFSKFLRLNLWVYLWGSLFNISPWLISYFQTDIIPSFAVQQLGLTKQTKNRLPFVLHVSLV